MRVMLRIMVGGEKDPTALIPLIVMTMTFQVCQEFMDLKIPRHAEILDVAAGSGILSAELQTGG